MPGRCSHGFDKTALPIEEAYRRLARIEQNLRNLETVLGRACSRIALLRQRPTVRLIAHLAAGNGLQSESGFRYATGRRDHAVDTVAGTLANPRRSAPAPRWNIRPIGTATSKLKLTSLCSYEPRLKAVGV